MVSEYNFLTMTEVLKNFPITRKEYTNLVVGGKLKLTRRKDKHRHVIEEVFNYFYPENEKTIVKKWSYPYEDINERWRIIKNGLKGFPVCFLFLDEEHETGIYRVYDCDRVLKFFAFIDGRDCTLLAYNRDVFLDFKVFMRSNLVWE